MKHLGRAAVYVTMYCLIVTTAWAQPAAQRNERESQTTPSTRDASEASRAGEAMRGSAGTAKSERGPLSEATTGEQSRTRWEMTHRASKIIGTHVRNAKGEALGDIKELVIDPRTGELSYAVVSFGGVLGLGDKLFAVPWKALKLDSRDHAFVLDIDKQRLQNAPGFDPDRWPDMANAQWNSAVHRFYGERYHAASPKSGRVESMPQRDREAAAHSTTGGEAGVAR